MIILNTTFYVHESIDRQFRQWIQQEYIPSALNYGLSEPSVAKLLMDVQENMDGYAVQLLADTIDTARTWHDENAAALKASLSKKHGEKILFFTTYMERLHP